MFVTNKIENLLAAILRISTYLEKWCRRRYFHLQNAAPANLGALIMDIRAAACILLTVVSVGAASAHHGWGSYDATKVFTINAPVETLTWADPHTHITVKYQGNTWEATLAPLFRMQARGLTQEMLKPGTTVAVEGYPSTQKQHEMRAERITVADKSVELR
jgi:Family of unknown function (DUF6152)